MNNFPRHFKRIKSRMQTITDYTFWIPERFLSPDEKIPWSYRDFSLHQNDVLQTAPYSSRRVSTRNPFITSGFLDMVGRINIRPICISPIPRILSIPTKKKPLRCPQIEKPSITPTSRKNPKNRPQRKPSPPRHCANKRDENNGFISAAGNIFV